MKDLNNKNIIIACGGTAGHINPGISIADTIKESYPNANILFVGAKNKMEMDLVPKNNYEIIGLPIKGFLRGSFFKNLKLIFLCFFSILKSFSIIKKFKPDLIIGMGAYPSFPILFASWIKKIPIILHEQNNVLGLTNKFFSKKAKKICVSYESLISYLSKEKTVLTGIPLMKNIRILDKKEALNYFSLDKNKKVLLVFSGSLGAKSINNAILKDLKNILDLGLQLIWITGNIYFDELINKIEKDFLKKIIIMPYCSDMQIPYSCADIAIARSGAVTTAEICKYNIPTIFIPSINVTDNQQKKNIEHLILSKACLYVEENVIKYHLFKQLKWLLENDIKMKAIKENLKKFYIEDSEKKILEQIRIFCK
jgi:UDP-N-acetylglucosamine--N-acetylmuramyl-(pentapeptide) pyrophosphoryl-undecaprenol N-acetylglucosamine transferase